MLTNRSAPHARIVPVLTVRDVRAAVAVMLKVENAAAVLARAIGRGARETAPLHAPPDAPGQIHQARQIAVVQPSVDAAPEPVALEEPRSGTT